MTVFSTSFRASLVREWELLCARPWDLAMISWVPLLLALLIVAIFSAGLPTRLPIGVVDQDHSSLSRQLIRFLDATPGLRITQQYEDSAAIEHAMRAGDVYGIVEIPGDFARDVKLGRAAQVTLIHNAQFGTHSGLIQRDVRTAVGTLSAGVEIAARNKKGESVPGARISMEPVRASLVNLFNPSLNYLQFLGVALLPALLHIFAMLAGAWSCGIELRDRSITEWETRCMSRGRSASVLGAILGKLLVPFITLNAVAMIAMSGLVFCTGWHPAGSLVYTLIGLSMMLALYMLLGAGISMLTRSLRTALSATGFITAPAFAFCGMGFPILAMPLPAQWWAKSLPLTHYLRLQTEQLQMGAPIQYSLPTLLLMLIASAILMLVIVSATMRSINEPASWGKR